MKEWLIAFDIDDTLITDEGKTSTRLNKLLLELQENNTLLFSSGRPYESIKSIVETIGLDFEKVYICAFNGSLLMKGNDEIYSHSIDGEDINKIACFYRDNHLYVQSYDDGLILFEEPNEYTELEKEITQQDTKRVEDIPSYKTTVPKMMGVGHEKKVKKAFEIIPADLRSTFHFTITKPFFLETMAKGISKGEAIEYFIKNELVGYERTMAFGDSYNDIEMLQQVKYSVSVDNAVDKVKEIARHTTKSNNDDGVYCYLDHFIRGMS